MRALALCSSCKRHVKVAEVQCPFCSAPIVIERAQPVRAARGLPGGRAALFLTGAALVAPGCTDEPEPDEENAVPVYGVAIDGGFNNGPGGGDAGVNGGQDGGQSSRDAGLVAQPYGIAIEYDASIETPRDAGPTCPQMGNLPVPVYGIGIDAPPRDSCSDAGADAGKDAGADAGKDAGKDSGLIAVPPYGVSIDSGVIVAPAYGVAIDPNNP